MKLRDIDVEEDGEYTRRRVGWNQKPPCVSRETTTIRVEAEDHYGRLFSLEDATWVMYVTLWATSL